MLVSCTTCRISTGRYITLYCVFKYFVQERELAIQRCSFTLKLSVKKLIRNEVARCPPASLRKKDSFTHPHSCILSSVSQSATRFLLPKML